jgi:hypothetical protein
MIRTLKYGGMRMIYSSSIGGTHGRRSRIRAIAATAVAVAFIAGLSGITGATASAATPDAHQKHVAHCRVDPSDLPSCDAVDKQLKIGKYAPKGETESTSSTKLVTSGIPGGAFGKCVVERESGGRPQVMNSSGHYGLYQFSLSTWEEYGGKASDFGHATVAEQNKVFANALAHHGEFNWAPYDGC